MRGKNGGPKTRAGKAAVGRNAIKHAIMSPHPVIIEQLETEEEWYEFREGILESLVPVGTLEEELAESIALFRWRLRRVVRYETAAINVSVHSAAGDAYAADFYLAEDKDDVPDPDPTFVAVSREQRVIPGSDALDRVTRYESHLHRLFVQTLHELEALQSRRRGERPHLARLDISSPPGVG